jgi:aldehyde reductase
MEYSADARDVKLNNGRYMPRVGYGTWKVEPKALKEAIVTAVKAGFRHFDCAAM